jgi:hypothetical protein
LNDKFQGAKSLPMDDKTIALIVFAKGLLYSFIDGSFELLRLWSGFVFSPICCIQVYKRRKSL